MTRDDINHRFEFHPADTYQRRHAHESVRTLCRTSTTCSTTDATKTSRWNTLRTSCSGRTRL